MSAINTEFCLLSYSVQIYNKCLTRKHRIKSTRQQYNINTINNI